MTKIISVPARIHKTQHGYCLKSDYSLMLQNVGHFQNVSSGPFKEDTEGHGKMF